MFTVFASAVKVSQNCQIMDHTTPPAAEESAKIYALIAVKKSFTEISDIVKGSIRSTSRYLAQPENYGKSVGGAKNKKTTQKDLRVLS